MPGRKRKDETDSKVADRRGKSPPKPKAAAGVKADGPGGKARPGAKGPRQEARPAPKTIENWPLGRLKRHPNQDALCHDLTGREFDQLVASMRREGLHQPIEALPDDTTLDGHQRLRAAEVLCWEAIDVWVRYDLADDPVAADRRHAEANLVRRQLDPLDLARTAKVLMEIEARRPFSDFDGRRARFEWEKELDLRDQVGKLVGLSGRHVQRLLKLLGLPMEIQRAVSAKRLSIVLGARVAGLEADVQQEIAAEIAAGGVPAEVVVTHLPEAAPAEVDPDREYELILAAGTRAVPALDGRVGEVRGGMDLDQENKILERVMSLIKRLIARNKALKKQRAETLRDLGDVLKGRGRP